MSQGCIRPSVLHIIDTGGPGGAETVFTSLAAHGQRTGINAAVVVPYEGWLAQRLRDQGVTPLVIPSKNSNPGALARRLAKVVRDSGANIIHTHLIGASVYGALIGMVQRVPVIAVFHGATDLKGQGSFTAAKRWLLNRAHVTPVAVSDAVRDALVEWGLRRDRIQLIQNGVDTEEFSPSGDGSLHSELRLDPHVRVVGAVGNIRPAKSYEVLIDAASVVQTALPDVHFVVAGAGSDVELARLRSIVERYNLSSQFHFLGFRPSSTSLYRSFSVMVSSANTEGLPLSFLEAMACGVPIAATANEGASMLIGETGAGLLSAVGDAGALAASIITLLSDPAKATPLAENGRSAVVRKFSLQRTLGEYRNLYEASLR